MLLAGGQEALQETVEWFMSFHFCGNNTSFHSIARTERMPMRKYEISASGALHSNCATLTPEPPRLHLACIHGDEDISVPGYGFAAGVCAAPLFPNIWTAIFMPAACMALICCCHFVNCSSCAGVRIVAARLAYACCI